MTTLKEAISKLDPANDNHWTADGLVRIEVLRFMTGTPGLAQADVDAEFPGYTRELAAAGVVKDETPPPAPVTQPSFQPAPKEVKVEAPSLKQELDAAALLVHELAIEADAVNKRLRDAQALHDKLLTKYDESCEQSKEVTQVGIIQDYLKRSFDERMEAAGRAKAFRDSGLTLRDIVPSVASPLDQSLSQKRRKK